jgi:hypothetical protein
MARRARQSIRWLRVSDNLYMGLHLIGLFARTVTRVACHETRSADLIKIKNARRPNETLLQGRSRAGAVKDTGAAWGWTPLGAIHQLRGFQRSQPQRRGGWFGNGQFEPFQPPAPPPRRPGSMMRPWRPHRVRHPAKTSAGPDSCRVLKRITVRGSIVGTRYDLNEAIAFAADSKVRSEFTTAPLAEINTIFERMKSGKIDGRMVLEFGHQ